MIFFIKYSREITILSVTLTCVSLILMFFWLRAYMRNDEKSRFFCFLANFIVISINMGIWYGESHFSNKFINEKTNKLLRISSNNEIEEILKDVPKKFMDKIYNKLKEKRLINNPSVEIEEVLEKILQEQKIK